MIRAKERSSNSTMDFETLYEQYHTRIFTWVHHRVFNWETSEDLTQEVLLRLWLALPTFEARPNAKLSSWVSRVTNNTVCDWLRSRQQHMEDRTSPFPDGFDLVEAHEPQTRLIEILTLQDVLSHLSTRHQAILLAYAQGERPQTLMPEYGRTKQAVSSLYLRTACNARKHYQEVAA